MSLAEVIKNKNLSLFRPNDNFEFDKQDKSDYNYCCCGEQIGLHSQSTDCLQHIMTIPVGRVGPGQCIRSVIWHIFEIQSSSRALLSIFSYI